MAKLVCQTAFLKCSQGTIPCPLNVVSNQTVFTSGRLAATVSDSIPFTCVASFGMCQSQTNPAVIAAKAAGSPSAPCTPAVAGPWNSGSAKVKIQGQVALNDTSKAICTLGGEILIKFPGQKQVSIP